MKNTALPLIITTILLFSNTLTFAQHKKDEALQAKLEAALDGFEGMAGVYAYNLKTKKEAAVNSDTIFPTASIVKVPILVVDKPEQADPSAEVNFQHCHSGGC